MSVDGGSDGRADGGDPSELSRGTSTALDRRIADEQALRRAPSVSAAVVRDGRMMWHGARGRIAGAVPSIDTPYRIGSITKTVVAILVMRLRDEGALDLADPLAIHIDGVPFGDRTIRQLLSHTGDLPEDPPGDWWERAPGRTWSELSHDLSTVESAQPTGRTYRYSNVGYALLGELIRRKRGADWAQVARLEVLEPLGMRQTADRPVAPHARGWSVHPWADVVMPEPESATGAMGAAGQLWSSVRDLCFILAAIGGQAPDVLSPHTAAEMRAPAVIVDPDTWSSAYGLGIELVRHDGRILTGNVGSMPGFRAAAWLAVREQVGAVVVANATSGPEPAAVAADLIAIVERHEPRRPEWTPLAEVDPALLSVTGVWYWGARPYALRLLHGPSLEVAPLTDGAGVATSAAATRFDRGPSGQWSGVDGPAAGETLHVAAQSDGRAGHLLLGTRVLTRTPYDPTAPVPGGLDATGWQGVDSSVTHR
jgi:CubicO group peptidase (beta-lactamase class C family)